MKNKYYVYIHSDPRTHEIKYVGKGCENHNRYLYWQKRNDQYKKWVKELIDLKMEPIVELIIKNLEEEEAYDIEVNTIKIAKDMGNKLFNISFGGRGTTGVFPNSEIRKKMSESAKLKYQDPEILKKYSDIQKKIKNTPEYKKAAAEKTRTYLSNPENLKNHILSKGEGAFKVFDRQSGRYIGEWISQSQCSRDLKLVASLICECLHKNRKHHKGYIFRYSKEEHE